MANVKLLIAYDGTQYKGWQKTKVGASIEGVLEDALSMILRQPIRLQAASRTDAGVHAKGQVVNFILEREELDIPLLLRSLNGVLPADISVWDAVIERPDFHPTLDSKGKIYHYHLCYGKVQLPHHRHYSWHFPHLLDLKAMHAAALELIGKKNFAAFTNVKKNETYNDHIRHIQRLEIEQIDRERLRFVVEGDHFLYKMVRNLVGTLCYVGCGKMQADEIPSLLIKQDRRLIGMTAPAHGLTLEKVLY